MKDIKKILLLLIILVFTFFCFGCQNGAKLDNAFEEINNKSCTVKMQTFQYWDGKYGLSERIGSQETIIYQNENQAYYEMNMYDRYEEKIKTEYQYVEAVGEDIIIYSNNSGNWAMDKKTNIEQYAYENPSFMTFKSKPSELFKYKDGRYIGDTELLKEELRFFLKTLYDKSGFHGKFICDIVEYFVYLDDDSIKTIHLQLSFYPQGYSGDRYDYNIYMEFSNIGETTVNKPLEIQ